MSYDFSEDRTPQEAHRYQLLKFLSKHKEDVKAFTRTIEDEFTLKPEEREKFHGPITINFAPPELMRFDEIIQTDHVVLEKVTLVFSSLIEEMQYLAKQAEVIFFPRLSLYGESVRKVEENLTPGMEEDEMELRRKRSEWKAQVRFGRFLNFLGQLYNFVARCESVVRSTMQQLSVFTILKDQNAKYKSFEKAQLLSVQVALGDLLSKLLTLDMIISQNGYLEGHKLIYEKLLHDVQKRNEKFGVKKVEVLKLVYLLQKIDTSLLQNKIFFNIINAKYENHEMGITFMDNQKLQKLFKGNIEFLFNSIVSSETQKYTSKIISVYALYLFQLAVWKGKGGIDKKFLKRLWNLQEEFPVVHCSSYCSVIFSIPEFFMKYQPKILKFITKNAEKEIRKFNEKNSVINVQGIVQGFVLDVVDWYNLLLATKAEGEASIKKGSSVNEEELLTENLILRGARLVSKMMYFVKKVIYLNITQGRKFYNNDILAIFKCMIMVKEIQVLFEKKNLKLTERVLIIVEKKQHEIQKIFSNTMERKKQKLTIEQYKSLEFVVNLTHGTPSTKRLIAMRLAMDLCSKGAFQTKEYQQAVLHLKRMQALKEFHDNMEEFCNCAWFYYHSKVLIPRFFDWIYKNPERSYSLKSFFLVIGDCEKLLTKAIHLEERDSEVWTDDDRKKMEEEIDKKEEERIQKKLQEKDEEKKGEGEGEGEGEKEKEEEGEKKTDLDDEPFVLEEGEKKEGEGEGEGERNGEGEGEGEGENEEEKDPYIVVTKKDTYVYPKSKILLDDYRTQVFEWFNEFITSKVQLYIEKYLRLNVISNNTLNYDTTSKQFQNMIPFLLVDRIPFLNVSIVDIIRCYLEKVFYTHTSVSQTDWKIYTEMRNLFYFSFGVDLTPSYLPNKTTHQGSDLLKVTANIAKIVRQYCYNFHSNFFIENCATTDSKKLSTLLVRHVSNSIRTHGTGIINTSIDYVFRFLKQRMELFSKFLFDDNIMGRLLKDERNYRDQKAELNNEYPFDWARDFYIKIKKLGLEKKTNRTFLDKFRDLIIQIGNALGFIRMVRAGGLNQTATSVRYVPDLEKIIDFEKLCENLPELKQSGGVLTTVLKNYAHRFSSGSDYFKLLEEALKKMMDYNSEDLNHLNQFYVIIPPATVSFIEDMIYGKEQMERKGKYQKFTNDGFALGIAFILKILDQNEKFNSLNWFSSVQRHYSKLKGKESSLAKAKNHAKEYKLLFYSFQSAKVFLSQ